MIANEGDARYRRDKPAHNSDERSQKRCEPVSSERGQPRTGLPVNYLVANAAARAGLPSVWPHVLRRSCGFYRAGIRRPNFACPTGYFDGDFAPGFGASTCGLRKVELTGAIFLSAFGFLASRLPRYLLPLPMIVHPTVVLPPTTR